MKPVNEISAVKEVGILGEGAFGTSIACLLADNGYQVKLWCHDQDVPNIIKTTGINQRYLPDIQLNSLITPTSSYEELFSCTYIFEAIPVKYLRSVLTEALPHIRFTHSWILMSKGIENDTLKFPSQILEDVCNTKEFCTLGGPSFAIEIATKQPTAVTIAGDCALVTQVQKMLVNEYFRPYSSTDITGVQIGGALKNVISVFMGMAKGTSENTQAFLFTRGLYEIVQLTEILGGRAETVYGLSGIGDLVLSSLSGKGRNATAGALLAQGRSLKEIEQQFRVLPEGFNTIVSMYQLIQQRNLDLPLCAAIYGMVYQGRQLHDVMNEMMNRPLEQECGL